MVVVDVIVVLAFLVPILPLLTTAPELVLTIPKCLPAAFCRAHLTIRCIGSRPVLGCEATAPPAADENPDESPRSSSCPESSACLEEVRGCIVPAWVG